MSTRTMLVWTVVFFVGCEGKQSPVDDATAAKSVAQEAATNKLPVTEDERLAEAKPAEKTNGRIEFNGKLWKATGRIVELQPDVGAGEVYEADNPKVRLVHGISPVASMASAKEVFREELLFGGEWVANGRVNVISANGAKQFLQYLAGKQHGEQLLLRSDGSVHKKLNYDHGTQHGVQETWENGRVWGRWTCERGTVIKEEYFNEDGSPKKY